MELIGVNIPDWMLLACFSSMVVMLVIVGVIRKAISHKFMSLRGRVVVITGGSSGIGKEVAKEAARRGASVALLARKAPLLESAAKEIGPLLSAKAAVTTHAVDVTDGARMKAVLEGIVKEHGHVDVVVASAGMSHPAKFEDIEEKDWERILRINVVGVRNTVAAALPFLKEQREGRIAMVSSAAGLTGIYGYTSYSASKYALKGFAEALAHETAAYNVQVSLVYPPDTKTPMLERENRDKPRVTQLLSEDGGLWEADVVGKQIVQGIQRGDFTIAFGVDGWMLGNLTIGMSPESNVFNLFTQVFLGGLLRFIALIYVTSWYRIIHKHDGKPPSKKAE